MKKFIMTAVVLLFIAGCSNDENVDATSDENNKSLEDQIIDVLKQNDFFPPENIIDYEIKEDYFYVFMHSQLNGLSIALLKHTPDSIQWLMGEQAIGNTASFGYAGEDENAPFVTVVLEDDPDVKGVKVLGEHAKLIQLTQELTDDYSVEVKYWIHFTEMRENPEDHFDYLPSKSVEYIR